MLVNVLMFILDSISQLDWLHPWLLTHWWTAFGDLLRDPDRHRIGPAGTDHRPDLRRRLLARCVGEIVDQGRLELAAILAKIMTEFSC